MIGTLDLQVIQKFKEFQEKTGKYSDLDIEDVQFDKKTINDIIDEFIKGSTPKYSSSSTNTIVIKSGQARGNYNVFDFKSTAYLDLIKVKNPKYLQNGDILINTTGVGTAGRVTLFDLSGSYVSDSHITALRYDLNSFNKFYLLHFFVNYGFKKLEAMAEGSGGQVELSMDKIKPLVIPIPKDYNEKYKSIDIQKAIVEFLEYSFDNLERIKSNIDKRYEIVSKMKKSLIPSTFKKTAIKNTFKKYAKENNIKFDITDIEFDIKRIHSKNKDEVICKKRMGFTPKTDNNGDINWFSVSDLTNQDGLYIDEPNSTKKTTMKLIREQVDSNNTGKSEKLIPIKQGDILVSFKLTVGTVKIYNSDLPAYCNEAIDILTLNEDFDNRYVAYNCMLEYPRNGNKTNNGITLNDDDKEKIRIFIPKDLQNYTSYKLQQILADFIEHIDNELEEKYFNKYNRAYEVVELLRETYLKRTFNKIVWS